MKVIKGGKDKTKTRKKKSRYDWEAIEIDFRARKISIRAISRKHKIDYAYLRREAIKRWWERDLTDQVKNEVRNQLVRRKAERVSAVPTAKKSSKEKVPKEKADGEKFTEEEIVKLAAFAELEFIDDWHETFRVTLDIVAKLKAEILSEDSKEILVGETLIRVGYSPKERAAMLNAITQAETRIFEGMRKNYGITGDTGGQEAPAILTDYGTGSYEKELARRKTGTDSI
jgi:hypothetical protein